MKIKRVVAVLLFVCLLVNCIPPGADKCGYGILCL